MFDVSNQMGDMIIIHKIPIVIGNWKDQVLYLGQKEFRKDSGRYL